MDRGAFNESLQSFADLLELIVGCTTGCQLSNRVAGSLRRLESYVSLNLGIIMTGIVGFYALMVMVDLLPSLLIENLEIMG